MLAASIAVSANVRSRLRLNMAASLHAANSEWRVANGEAGNGRTDSANSIRHSLFAISLFAVLLCSLEILRIRRPLALARGHQVAVRAQEVGFPADRDVIVVLVA